jgi:hypothetical protein
MAKRINFQNGNGNKMNTEFVNAENGQTRSKVESVEMKQRGQDGKNATAKVADLVVREALSLNGALELAGGDETKVLKYFNDGLYRADKSRLYEELWGFETKRSAVVKSLVAIGVPEDIAKAQVATMFQNAGLVAAVDETA